ncbi:GPW/gp25 family protein [Escherichia coli]
MTARYLGMNRSDGLTVTDLEHISQSIGDILRTPVGSRVMRRDYGSLLASMIDQPQTPALELQIKVACYMAVLKWEPRVTLSSVTTERSFDGRSYYHPRFFRRLIQSGESPLSADLRYLFRLTRCWYLLKGRLWLST